MELKLLLVAATLFNHVSCPLLKNILEDNEHGQPWCKANSDCPVGQYCWRRFDVSYCMNCTDCSNYFKENSSSGCAKSVKDCGPCLDGYQEHKYDSRCQWSGTTINSTPSTFNPDHKETQTEKVNATDNINWALILGVLLAAIGIIIGIIALCFWYRKKNKKEENAPNAELSISQSDESNSDQQVQQECKPLIDPPPPYKDIVPSAPRREENEISNAEKYNEACYDGSRSHPDPTPMESSQENGWTPTEGGRISRTIRYNRSETLPSTGAAENIAETEERTGILATSTNTQILNIDANAHSGNLTPCRNTQTQNNTRTIPSRRNSS